MAEKLQMPSSGGGLIRYFDDYKSKIEIKPTVIIASIIVVILLELYLHKFRVLG
jgi:preprotein translocase subunit Sec61beta